MNRVKLSVVALTAALACGCSIFPPPRPLGPGEVYYCCPGSAVPRRIVLPEGLELAGVKTERNRTCGTF